MQGRELLSQTIAVANRAELFVSVDMLEEPKPEKSEPLESAPKESEYGSEKSAYASEEFKHELRGVRHGKVRADEVRTV